MSFGHGQDVGKCQNGGSMVAALNTCDNPHEPIAEPKDAQIELIFQITENEFCWLCTMCPNFLTNSVCNSVKLHNLVCMVLLLDSGVNSTTIIKTNAWSRHKRTCIIRFCTHATALACPYQNTPTQHTLCSPRRSVVHGARSQWVTLS